jgi:hypothetical protein
MNDNMVEWQDGRGEPVEIGYLNPNGQQCCGHCGVQGTDHLQYAYKVDCTICGYVYGANGSDMHERKCPECREVHLVSGIGGLLILQPTQKTERLISSVQQGENHEQ